MSKVEVRFTIFEGENYMKKIVESLTATNGNQIHIALASHIFSWDSVH